MRKYHPNQCPQDGPVTNLNPQNRILHAFQEQYTNSLGEWE
jgi:hypothetical protein